MPHVEGESEPVAFLGQAVGEELGLRLQAQRLEQRVHPVEIEGRRHDVDPLVDVEEIGRSRPERTPHRRGGPLRNDDLRHPELRGEHPRVGRPRSAEGKHHEVAWVKPLLDRRLVDEVRHLELDDLGNAARAGIDIHVQPIRNAADGTPRRRKVEAHGAAGEVLGIQAPEREIRVRHRGHLTPAPVADWSGLGPGALRADTERAGELIDADHASAPAPDRLDVHLGQVVLVLVHLAAKRVGRLSAVDDADVERSAAHVRGDDVLVAHGLGRVPGAHDTGDRSRIQGEERRAPGDVDRNGAARALGDLERCPVSRLRKPQLDVGEIAGGHRPHVGVETGCGRAFVLSPLRHELMGAGHEQSRLQVLDHCLDPPLMRGLEERPQEADGDGFHALGDELADGLRGLRLVQRHDHACEAVHTFGYAPDQALGNDRGRLPALRNVHDLAHFAAVEPARASHDVDDIAVPAGSDEPDPGAALLHDRIGPDRGAVGNERGLRQQLRHRLAALAGGGLERVHEALGEVPRRRRRLRAHHASMIVDDHAVGERSADIEAAQIVGHGLRSSSAVARRSLSGQRHRCVAETNTMLRTQSKASSRPASMRSEVACSRWRTSPGNTCPIARRTADWFGHTAGIGGGSLHGRNTLHPSVSASWRSGPTRRIDTSWSTTITAIGDRSRPPIDGTRRRAGPSNGSFRR